MQQSTTTNDKKLEQENTQQNDTEIFDDKYDEKLLIHRYTTYKNMYMSDKELIKNGLKIRHQNTP